MHQRLKVAILTTRGGSFVTNYLVKHLDVRGIVVDAGKFPQPKNAHRKTTLEKLQFHLLRHGVGGVARAVLMKVLRRQDEDPFRDGARLEERFLQRLDNRFVGHSFLVRQIAQREFVGFAEIGRFYGLPIIEVDNINNERSAAALASFDVDLAVIVGGRIVKPVILTIPRIGTLNKHSAILPRHRGLAGEYWCLYHEDFEHLGVTVHYVDAGLDSGNIIVQKKLVFAKGDTPSSLRFKSEVLGREAIVEAVRLIETTGTKGIPQDESKASKNQAPTRESDQLLYAKLPMLWQNHGVDP